MDAALIGRCGTQNWTGFEKTMSACLAAEVGAVEFRTRAGRTMRLDVAGGGVLRVILLAHPSRAEALRAAGWVRAGKGQGAVSRNGRDTGTVAGSPLLRSFSGSASNLVEKVVALLKDELAVSEPRELHFTADSRSLAELLRVPAAGHEHRWHHRTEVPVGSSAGSGSGGQRGPTHCRRCGQSLGDPLSISRGYGPACWAKIHEKDRVIHRLR
jgi:hypothetical protein